jgi:hypothetical protein
MPTVQQYRVSQRRAAFCRPDHPTVLNGDHTFGVNEQATAHLRTTNLVVHCLAISTDSAQIRLVISNQEIELYLREDLRRGAVPGTGAQSRRSAAVPAAAPYDS